MLREDVRFFQRNAVESKQQELVARRAIGVVAEGIENKNVIANSVKEAIKKVNNGTEGCRVEPKNQNEEIIMSLFQKHNADLKQSLLDDICSYIARFDRLLS